MQTNLLIAACLALVVGLVHSILGEILIFNRLRQGGLVPTRGEPLLKERNVRILWASWHVVTVFGWALGAILFRLAMPSAAMPLDAFVRVTIAIAMIAGAVLVFVGTRARHPGWIGLLGVAVLTWFV